jgi:hypothetical protein
VTEYPDSWSRHTPKGYDPYSNISKLENNESVINDGLALRVFQNFCCDGCTCKTESDHALE